MKSKGWFVLVAATISIIWSLGCDGDRKKAALTVDPLDGAANVKLNSNITLKFEKPASPDVVKRNFHLMIHQEMNMVMDSMMHGTHAMDSMSMGAMCDSSMMEMMQRHSVKGGFMWNSDNTQCIFNPDSMMTPNTEYAIHMGGEMMKMIDMEHENGMMTGGHGGMMGDQGGLMSGDMMIYFSTGADVGGNDDEHSSHH